MNKNNVLLKKNERLDDLLNGLNLIQNINGYCFTQDAVLLGNFANVKSTDKVADLCGGNGVISVLIAGKQKVKSVTCVELQKSQAELAERNAQINSLEDKLNVVCGDVKNWGLFSKGEDYDVVVVNPPFFKKTQDTAEDEKSISRKEVKLNLNDLISTCKKILKFGGKLFIIFQASRFVEAVCVMKENSIEPKIVQFVYPKKDKEPNVFLMMSQKGGKTGLKFMPNIICKNDDNSYTKQLIEIYNCKGNKF